MSNLKMLLGSCTFRTAVYMTDCRDCLWQHFLLQIFTRVNCSWRVFNCFLHSLFTPQGRTGTSWGLSIFGEFLSPTTLLLFRCLVGLQIYKLPAYRSSIAKKSHECSNRETTQRNSLDCYDKILWTGLYLLKQEIGTVKKENKISLMKRMLT